MLSILRLWYSFYKTYLWEEKGVREEMDGIAASMVMSLSKLQEVVKDREAYCATVRGATERQT